MNFSSPPHFGQCSRSSSKRSFNEDSAWPMSSAPSTPTPDPYTWWNNRGQAGAKNVGWRIDCHLAKPGMAACARRESIYLDQRFSDHAPLIIDYNFKL